MIQDQPLVIFFFSGLIFFILGLLAILESKRNNSQLKFLKVLPYLGIFAIFSAFSNWIDFFGRIPPGILGINSYNLILLIKPMCLIIAFISIFLFGLHLLKQSLNLPQIRPILLIHSSLFAIIFVLSYSLQIDTVMNLLVNLSRYLFALPGSILATLGAWKKAEALKGALPLRVSKSFKLMSLGFGIYSILFILSIPSEAVQQYLTLVLALKATIVISIIIHSYIIISTSEQEYKLNLQNRVNSLEILSHVDEVSGLHNHRYFQDCLKQLVNKGSENKELSCSLLLIDIDYFKEFNDTFGHPEGDRLLNEIGRLIKNLIRNTDVVARYGGDELAVVLQHTHLSEAYDVAEKIRRDVDSHCFLNSPSKKVTLSIGVANFPQCAETKDELIQVADTALYRAKETRNKTECYSLF